MLKIWACAKLDILFPCSFIMTNSTKAAAPQWAVHILQLRYWFSSEDRFSGGWEVGIVLPLNTKSHILGIIAIVYMYRRVITRLCGTCTVYLNADEQLYVKKPWIANFQGWVWICLSHIWSSISEVWNGFSNFNTFSSQALFLLQINIILISFFQVSFLSLIPELLQWNFCSCYPDWNKNHCTLSELSHCTSFGTRKNLKHK